MIDRAFYWVRYRDCWSPGRFRKSYVASGGQTIPASFELCGDGRILATEVQLTGQMIEPPQ